MEGSEAGPSSSSMDHHPTAELDAKFAQTSLDITSSSSGNGQVAVSKIGEMTGIDLASMSGAVGVNLSNKAQIVNAGWAKVPHAQSYTKTLENDALTDLPELDAGELCTFCSTIPFNLLGYHQRVRKQLLDDQFPSNDIAFIQILENTKSCFFCQKIALLFQRWKNQNPGPRSDLDLSRTMVDVSPSWELTHERAENGAFNAAVLQLQLTFNFWIVSEPSSPTFTFKRCSDPLVSVSDFCSDFSSKGKTSTTGEPYNARARPLVADKRILQRWRSICTHEHESSCQQPLESDRLGMLRLIDVDGHCLTEVADHAEYVALSYVWGDRNKLKLLKSNLTALTVAGSLDSSPPSAAISDAIKVTRALGVRYLWADALCIIQDDETDQQLFIPYMDSIYRGASVTIMAFSGTHADEGLPGIRPLSRSQEVKPFVIKGTPVTVSLDPIRTEPFGTFLGESVWDRRGWTYQEKIFSTRALIFTSEQIYWECQGATWCEDSIREHPDIEHLDRRVLGTKPYLRYGSRDMEDFPAAYARFVESYTSRELTFQKDILRAFSGFFHFMTLTWGATFFWGLPCDYLSSSLQWSITRQVPKSRMESSTFTADDGSTHTLPIPSWTWAAWQNVIRMPNVSAGSQAIEVIFYRMLVSGELFEIPEQMDVEHRERLRSANRTEFALEDVPPGLMDHPFRLVCLYFWSYSATVMCHWHVGFKGELVPNIGCPDRRSFRCSWKQKPPYEIAVVEKGIPLQPGEVLFSSAEEAVVIGRDPYTRVGGCNSMLTLMLLRRLGPLVCRYAVVSVAEEDWLELNPTWKPFILG